MGTTIINLLKQYGVLAHVMLTPQIELLLSALEDGAPPNELPQMPDDGILAGRNVTVVGDIGKSPLPGFDFALALPTEPLGALPYKLKFNPPVEPTGFDFWLVLADHRQVEFVFDFVRSVPGLVLTGAEADTDDEGVVTLKSLPDKPILVSKSAEAGATLGPALLISATPTAPATLRLTPDTDSTAGIVKLGLKPDTVMFGNSGIGFSLPDGLALDESEEAAAPGQGVTGITPQIDRLPADEEAWRGLLARQLTFYLPPSIPLFGGTPINGYLALPTGPGGANLVLTSEVPERPAAGNRPARPGYSLRIECLDPTAEGLSGFVPTLISASMTLPLDGAQADLAGAPLTFAAGRPLRLTLTVARDPTRNPSVFRIGLALAGQGDAGLVSVTSTSGADPAKIFNMAAAFATSLMANGNAQSEADGSVLLSTLAAAGAAISMLFEDESRFVLHGVELVSTGHGLPVGETVAVTLDYTVTARVTGLSIPGGALAVKMNPNRPLRIRVRRVTMNVDLTRSGLDMVDLDYSRAEMEVEDPGAWNLEGLDNLFDVLGSRSGRGSLWVEVDLRFKLNLGPIRVSGATLRATLVDGEPVVSLAGLTVGLNIAEVISGEGQLHLGTPVSAALSATIDPLKVVVDAGFVYDPPLIVLTLDVELPAPIPLANSGLGLFGLGGLVGFSARPNYAAYLPDGQTVEADPILSQLQWQKKDKNSFKSADDQSTFGFDAVVATLPDMGHSFSAKAGLMLTVPDVAVRAGLNGRVLAPRVRITNPSYPPSKGVSYIGFLGIDSAAVSFAVIGSVDLLPLLEVRVPLAGYFPITGVKSNWYLYLGADGAPHEGRQIGPIAARVLPDILDAGADAYLMMRGNGIRGWPHGRSNILPQTYDGYIVAFGFGIQAIFGAAPVAWAELYASLDLLLGTKPPTLAGFGRAGGSLHLGPFSLGVDSIVKFRAQKQLDEWEKYFWAQVTGRIDLLFDELEETITISFGDKEPKLVLPDADRHPLDRVDQDGKRIGTLGTLTDDSYRVVAPLVEDPNVITADMHVWPDAYVSLPFAIVPQIANTAASQFPGVIENKPKINTVGSQMLNYEWHVTRLELFDVTDEPDPYVENIQTMGQLAACWQAPRSAPGGDISELVLFSTSGTLWVNRLADGGSGLKPDPLQEAADFCQRKPRPLPGWALGFSAVPRRAGIYLPTDIVSSDPLVSQFTAQLTHAGVTPTDEEQPLDGRTTLPQPFTLVEAMPVAWQPPQEIERSFDGYLLAPDLQLPEEAERASAFKRQRLRLMLSEPVVNGMLLLVTDPEYVGEDGVLVLDNHGVLWPIAAVHEDPATDDPDWGIVQLAAPDYEGDLLNRPPPRAVRWLTMDMPFNMRLGIAGVGGITLTALAAAHAEQQAIAQQTKWQKEAFLAGPGQALGNNTPATRTILEAGKLYRLDIDMHWDGKLYDQDETGQRRLVETRPNKFVYTPTGGAERTTNRQLFFRTTGHAVAAQPRDDKFPIYLSRQQSQFEPQMLQRYLSGYEPAQSELFFFCDDPLRAHFSQDHVAALAEAYGYLLGVGVRRTDRNEPDLPAPYPLVWSAITNPAFLTTAADRRRYDLAVNSPCLQPTPGATASLELPLAPEAWYEVFVQASPENDAWHAPGRLPGVTFRTSRWRNPQEMVAGLGWSVLPGTDGQTVFSGDLVVTAAADVATRSTARDDQALVEALAALGINDWPVSEAPRLSRLWSVDDAGNWLLAGVLIESPEPIIRPERVLAGGQIETPESITQPKRVDISGLTLDGATVTFTLHHDRTAQRLLFVTSTPTDVAAGAARLVLHCRDGSTTFNATLALPARPAFAEDEA
ncbi:MAG: hypothetical protein IPM53_20915 [Anaerolineaceae bacterium]|nr:hypothetical protein [Anaerolineaceae bacterium]